MKAKHLLSSAIMVMVSTTASAQFYVGGGVGQSKAELRRDDFSTGLSVVDESKDERDMSWKGFVGYNFNNAFAIEGGYSDLGNPEYNYNWDGVGSAEASLSNSSWFLAGKGTFAISDTWAVFGKLGVTRNQAKVSATSQGATFNPLLNLLNSNFQFPVYASEDSTDVLYGLGVQYSVNPRIKLRLEYENFGDFGESSSGTRSKVESMGASVVYGF